MKLVRHLISFLAVVMVAAIAVVAFLVWHYRDYSASKLEAKYALPPSSFVEAGGARFHVRQEGSGPDILLLHASFGNLYMWDGWVETLQDKYRVTRLDLIAHGLTGSGPQEQYTNDELAEMLHELTTKLNLENFHLVGTSIGGILAFTYAADHPERVNSLTLINSAGLLHRTVNPNASQVLPIRSRILSKITPKFVVDKFVTHLIGDPSKVTPKILETYYDMTMREGNRAAVLSGFKNYKPRNPNPWLNKITCPTLIIWSDGSVLPVEEAKEFSNNLGSENIVIEIIEGGGHALPISHPAETSQIAERFWESIAPFTASNKG